MGNAHGICHHCQPRPHCLLYCFDNNEPDLIYAFQQYLSVEASHDFLQTSNYAEYLKEVEPLLAGPPQVTPLTPFWFKPA